MVSLDVSEAVGILESIGCDQDPIMWRGGESTPSEIPLETEGDVKASKIRIRYWDCRHEFVKGSLYSMVKDRLGLQQHIRKIRVPQTKTYQLFECEQHGSGMIYFDIIKQIESDTKVKFTFPSDAFEDYKVLIEAIASQLRDERIRCTTYSDDDISITIMF